MDTHRLKYFLRIAEEGSMSRASRVLGIAQPALSRQMRLLEADLGVTLFRRTSRGVELTDEGEQLQATTAAPLRQLELAMQWVGSPGGRVDRLLVVGMPATIAAVLATPLLIRIGTTFPHVSLRVTVAESGQLVERMMTDEIDFAVIYGPPADERPFYNDLLAEDVALVGGPASNLAPDRPVRFAALADLPLVLPPIQPGLGYTIQHIALRQKVTIASCIETDSLEVSKQLVAAGLGYGIVPLSSCACERAAGTLRYAPIVDPIITQHVGLAVRPQLALPRGFVTRFGSAIRDEVAALIGSREWPARLLAPTAWTDDPHRERSEPPLVRL
ncbi:MAG TPA: LysR family transcriptional regulator [Mycobacteriales bacterium]|nr:LysR family transcriptional regulator [Mycobacteriales bacterium]